MFFTKLANKVTEKCKHMSDLDISQDDVEHKLKGVRRNHATAHNGTTAPLCVGPLRGFLLGVTSRQTM